MSTVKVLGRTERTGMLVARADGANFGYFGYFLTECCEASATGTDDGTACRACYELVDPAYGDVYDEARHGPIIPLH